ncbi:MAG TPA: prenyltransferase/squalene oxidase repeat-containing protein [Armatimonadota bacterium]
MTAVLARARILAARQTAVHALLAARTPEGYWEGRLSSSALSTATAVSALALAGAPEDAALIRDGVGWLCATQLADGGWGDTADSPSNMATTLLAVSALRLAALATGEALPRAERYLVAKIGATPPERARAILAAYGKDRTFAVPILMNCALAGLVRWQDIPGLPFEMAACPQQCFKALRLDVVSYALPALIAIGLVLHRQAPTRNPFVRLLRNTTTGIVLRKLARIQPEHGGYLEATPLTSFVAMSLLPLFGREYPVTAKCLAFLRASARADGSWPIDSDLSMWVTTSAVTALAQAGALVDGETVRRWIAAHQHTTVHPYTQATPGGWNWTFRPGGVPDADDTAGALIALAHLGGHAATAAGARWLLQLQNRDGGWPTFCRGWGQLPFDRSSPDITAHALRALRGAAGNNAAVTRAVRRGLAYLTATQREDGAWVPLWFGNQGAVGHANPVLGTARVLLALAQLETGDALARDGVQYLCRAQQADGGWGGDLGVAPSIEETALAISALSAYPTVAPDALARGTDYLVRRIEADDWRTPAPIGLYFASLWYAEALYPLVWTVEALGRVTQ